MPPAPIRYAPLPAPRSSGRESASGEAPRSSGRESASGETLRSSGRESASGEGMIKDSLTNILQRLKHDSRTVITHRA